MTQAMRPSAVVEPFALQVQDLCFAYSQQRQLFNNWSARIPPGLTLVRGGDGAGKTTLLRLLAGDLPASKGKLQADGVCLHESPDRYQRQVFWVDPRTTAWDQLTPYSYFKTLPQRYGPVDASVLADLLDGLSLTAHLNKAMFMLSTGSKRKVWLAGAFASGAAVTLLDEPFAALDKASIAFVLDVLEDAAMHPARAFVVADYSAPVGLPLAQTIDLGEP